MCWQKPVETPTSPLTVTVPRSEMAPAGSLTSTYCNLDDVAAVPETVDTTMAFDANANTAPSPGIVCSAIFCTGLPFRPIEVTTARGLARLPCHPGHPAP